MLRNDLRALEDQLVSPAIRASASALDRLISERFVEFGSSGRIYSKQEVIAQILAAPNIKLSVTDFDVKLLSEVVALVTYRTEASLRSSIWRCEKGEWRIVFHQGAIAKPT